MNERIRQLWDQAAKAESDPSWEGQTKFMEKFAELIVKECAQVIQDKNDIENYLDSWDHGFVAGLATAIDAIEQHFGVE